MLDSLILKLGKEFPKVRFVKSSTFKWEPDELKIYYSPKAENSVWSLLHEVGHMVLEHKNYRSDFSLLKMEAQAWHKARELASINKIEINPEHIEKCLDSYRDWLYARSSCRECLQTGLEISTGLYKCINCHFRWKVTPERFCRVYRKKIEPSNVQALS
jgi:hypothetical protein